MAKLKTGISVVVPPVVRNVISKLVAAVILVTFNSYLSVPDCWLKIMTSVATTVLLFTVNDVYAVVPAALANVIEPVGLFIGGVGSVRSDD